MAGISPRLPLMRDLKDGYVANKTLREVIKQNVKNLLLTAPGERMMDPLFGVGLRQFLFEQNVVVFHEDVRNAIYTQIKKYMPFVQIVDIDIMPQVDLGTINITFEYSVPSISAADRISIESAMRNNEIQPI